MTLTLTADLPETATWEIDPIHSTARFGIRHHGIASFRGGFTGVSGAYDGAGQVLSGSVRADNIDLQGHALFKEHLLSERWFDAENHPTLSFRSGALATGADGSLQANGELTIKGIAQPITATGSVRGPIQVRHNDGHTSDRLAIDLSTTVDRRGFGIDFNNELAAGILNLGWDVTIEVALELTRS
ncbi:MAG TPA: YceI family protein [Solirubrobacteraceae bacterium]|jgi:polyisoprenoid-binding protein YceI|nr:YceI family protein [Solirubrobacteraceae bacterium]